MTRDDILRMAREAGLIGVRFVPDAYVLRFAALVAAAEREAIAKHIESKPMADRLGIIEMIRARGQS